MRLENKTVVITGAASGIGQATAERCAEEGARVIVTDVDTEGGEAVVRAIEDAGGEAAFHELDVTDSDQFHAVVDAVADDGLDVLINNAGTGHPAGSLEDVDEDMRDFVMNVNVNGVWNGCHAALPHLKSQATVPSSTSVRWRVSSDSPSRPPTR